MDRATLEDVELEYEVVGTGEPVLLIGHVVADALAPLTTEPALTGYRLVRYRRRGFGGSTHTPPPVTIAQHAADAAALLGYLGLAPSHVVAGSSGGCVALQLAVDHPQSVATLALLEPSLLSLPRAQGVLAKVAPALDAYAAGRATDAVMLFFSAVSGLDPKGCEAMFARTLPGGIAAGVDDVDTVFGAELPALSAWSFGTAEAARITVPVLSLVGSETDPLWFDTATLLRVCLRDVEEHTIDGAGHFLQLQQPEPVARAIGDFLARHPVNARVDATSA
jgi:pimeloyl-ACP methyl ester carboxylesterase